MARRHHVRSYTERRGGRLIHVRAHASNPRRRRRRMSALQRRYFGARRSNPRRASHRRPARRTHSRGARRRVAIYANPRRSYRRHRNPRLFGGMGNVKSDLMNAAFGAAGAIGLKLGWGYVSPKLPATLQTGLGAAGAQAALIMAAGWGLSKAIPRQRRAIGMGVIGALTVLVYSVALQYLQTSFPSLAGLGDVSDYGMGAYMPGAQLLPAPAAMTNAAKAATAARLRGLGVYSPGSTIPGPTPNAGMGAYMQYGPYNR